jgi:hypothetical protein
MTVTSIKQELSTGAAVPVPWDRFLANSKVPQGQTDEIITWMTKLSQKRQSIRSTRARDLHKEAVLESARRAAATALQTLQQERMARWRKLRPSLAQPPPPPSPSPSGHQQRSLCECDSCFLCRRHRVGVLDTCYCSVIFSPRPVFMDLGNGGDGVDIFASVAESQEMDSFLASLGPCSSQNLKRKSQDELWFLSRKRCKA